MKRSELAPGMVVEVRSGTPGGPYTSYSRAIVLSTDRWGVHRPNHQLMWTSRTQYFPLPDNVRVNGVPVAVERTDYWSGGGCEWKPDVVQPSQIVPVGTGDAEAARKQAEREARDARQREADQRWHAEKTELGGRLEALGVTSPSGVIWERPGVHMDTGTLRRLLHLAENGAHLSEGLRDLWIRLGEMEDESGTFGVYEDARRLLDLAEHGAAHECDTGKDHA